MIKMIYLKQISKVKPLIPQTKRIFSLILLLIGTIIITSTAIKAQVTIGSENAPEKGALLEYKEKEITNPTSDITSLENSTRGVLQPKVFLYDVSKLTPLYGGANDGTGIWSDESTPEERLKATGMIVYNVNPKAINMDEGLYMWQIDQWVKLNKDGAAVIDPINCSTIRINGSYIQGVPLNDNNFLSIDLNVTKKGSFVISVLSGNGYSFYYSGMAQQTGTLTVKVPAQGTPALVGNNTLTFSGVNLVSGCEPKINVQQSVATYTIMCSSAVVQGQYLKNQGLNSSNIITMNVNVSQTGSYDIYTEQTNVVTFRATGKFAVTGSQKITLIGSGSPTINQDFKIVVKANTANGTPIECSVIIPITLPDMTYAIIGTGLWSWNVSARQDALSNASSGSFSPTGIVKIKSFKNLWTTTFLSTAARNLTNGVNGKYPDVVLYFAYGANPTTEIVDALLAYINAGGSVLYGSSDNTASSVNILMQGLFGMQTAQNQTGGGSDNVYQIKNDSSDPIINGPFGNLSGMYWGEDNDSNYSIVMSSLPANSVQICSAQSTSKPTIDPSISILWYNSSKNFVYFGDSTGASQIDTSTDSYPTIYNTAGLPVSKLYGPGGNYNRYVYNAALELNSIVYLLRRAATNGINPY